MHISDELDKSRVWLLALPVILSIKNVELRGENWC